jgi:diaminopimelate decarboxylase
LSKLIRKKKGQKKNFIIIDSGMNNLLRPSLYDAKHNIVPVKIVKNAKKKFFDIVGPICETSDSFSKNISLRDMQKDDLVVICSTGAYGSCMSSNYNLRGIAKEVFIKGKKVTET